MDAGTPAVAVQHHPRRADLIAPLQQSLRGLDVLVVADPEPDGKPSPWRTYRCCLEYQVEAELPHQLVLQDDVVVHPDLARLLPGVVGERPVSLVSLFTGRWPERTAITAIAARDAGQGWAGILPGSWVAAVALLWPLRLAESLLGFVDTARWYAPQLADDEIIGRWCRATRTQVWHHIPSLVEHPDDVPSLLNPYRKNRSSVVPWGKVIRPTMKEEP